MNIQKSTAEGEMEWSGELKSATPLPTTVATTSASHTGITTGPDCL